MNNNKAINIKIDMTKDGIVCTITNQRYIIENFKGIYSPIIYDIKINDANQSDNSRSYSIYYNTYLFYQSNDELFNIIYYILTNSNIEYCIDDKENDELIKLPNGNMIYDAIKKRTDINFGISTTVIFPNKKEKSFIIKPEFKNDKILDIIMTISPNNNNIDVVVNSTKRIDKYKNTVYPVLLDVSKDDMQNKIYHIYYDISTKFSFIYNKNDVRFNKIIIEEINSIIRDEDYSFIDNGLLINGNLIGLINSNNVNLHITVFNNSCYNWIINCAEELK